MIPQITYSPESMGIKLGYAFESSKPRYASPFRVLHPRRMGKRQLFKVDGTFNFLDLDQGRLCSLQ